MKELSCFVIGLVAGGLLVQKSKEVESLEKELDRERVPAMAPRMPLNMC
ncbi:hypothetical protein ACFSKY_16760 [Azotobacter chroococcum]|uniref:Uncharacterized protein n=1 Tax=Azotobacter chroococcum TaxID=353 RepID=A0A4R1PNQ3_9GAMM|nr:hypothetical protein [Azotobacter chroococcum]TCL31946.1 hypothetical protein EV691_110127 [Azotobacter chroococcum]